VVSRFGTKLKQHHFCHTHTHSLHRNKQRALVPDNVHKQATVRPRKGPLSATFPIKNYRRIQRTINETNEQERSVHRTVRWYYASGMPILKLQLPCSGNFTAKFTRSFSYLTGSSSSNSLFLLRKCNKIPNHCLVLTPRILNH
jgi:hypothetical protein